MAAGKRKSGVPRDSMSPNGLAKTARVVREMKKLTADFDRKGPLHSDESVKKLKGDRHSLRTKMVEIIRADGKRQKRQRKVVPKPGKGGR
jgi:hypothetical protein